MYYIFFCLIRNLIRRSTDEETSDQMQHLHKMDGTSIIKTRSAIPCCGDADREHSDKDHEHTMNTATLLTDGENSIAV